ncbi:unnamed protein product [Protopolystoma xenopodis]|uniref:Uncharacterized protein n=1 Tax=Protopolystoma xenopodis TaxID=117903 RepID=A0A3S5AGC4_9PLAT|nr:unnamed protein product [Protopolystoma xenopodis]
MGHSNFAFGATCAHANTSTLGLFVPGCTPIHLPTSHSQINLLTSPRLENIEIGVAESPSVQAPVPCLSVSTYVGGQIAPPTDIESVIGGNVNTSQPSGTEITLLGNATTCTTSCSTSSSMPHSTSTKSLASETIASGALQATGSILPGIPGLELPGLHVASTHAAQDGSYTYSTHYLQGNSLPPGPGNGTVNVIGHSVAGIGVACAGGASGQVPGLTTSSTVNLQPQTWATGSSLVTLPSI